jgi:hypothetical protein
MPLRGCCFVATETQNDKLSVPNPHPSHLTLLLPQHLSQQWARHPQAVAPQGAQCTAAVAGWRLQLGVISGAQALPASAHAPALRAVLVQIS